MNNKKSKKTQLRLNHVKHMVIVIKENIAQHLDFANFVQILKKLVMLKLVTLVLKKLMMMKKKKKL